MQPFFVRACTTTACEGRRSQNFTSPARRGRRGGAAARSVRLRQGGCMQNIREADQAEEQQIAQEQAHAEGHLEARVLHRPIRELPTLQPATTLERSATVRDAVEAMQKASVSCVLVVDQGRLAGLFTERDVVTKVRSEEHTS